MNLRTRIMRAGVWTLGGYGAELITRFGSNLIMTRLLFPEAFGLVAASTSLIIGLTLISDFGIRAVIIRSPHGESDSFLHSAWVFQLSRGIFLWISLAALCALLSLPAIRASFSPASVFANPVFPLLTAILGLALILSGLESTSIALNLRGLNYRSVMVVDLAGKIVAVPIMLICALFYPNVWSLAAGALSGAALRAILSHFAIPGPRMAFRWEKEHFEEIVHFGKWITVSSVASFATTQSDVIIFGMLMPSGFLGLYFIAKTLVTSIGGLLDRLNSTLTLAVLGEVHRNNPKHLRDRYYRYRLPLDLFATISGGVLFATADQIVKILYDVRYNDAGPMLRILALSLAIYPFQIIRHAFTVVAKTRTVAFVSIGEAFSLVFLLLLGLLAFGPMGAIAGVAISGVIPSAIYLFLAHGQRWINIWQELRTFPMFVSGVLVGKTAIAIWQRLKT
jgi:O-antigen/teichoic acid export membrane protein